MKRYMHAYVLCSTLHNSQDKKITLSVHVHNGMLFSHEKKKEWNSAGCSNVSGPRDYHRRRQWHPTPVLLPGKSYGQRSLVGCSLWGRWVSHDSDFTFTFHFHALEKEMATHPGVLAWRIPGMGEPGRLPSIGSRRVGHDWCDLAAAAAEVITLSEQVR